ncbi:MAG: DUF742 domain-containing protein [Hamadaea sp.]|uniref:DUF742 domain-containing protein n=1 Tax=Hamadaea sp. NPDC050747 TaxID=3155789 RepID=UPI00182BC64A|nr:DUF742 domain-containing protein [Hamadaea sp.]NUR49396.1 DUF742 domain-containing protein [Hamadaea sp.]NUT08358.1 DUF742 domain-containing protein [Hamadaea sp.]
MTGPDPVQPEDQAWLDDDAGPVVRPYALAAGTTAEAAEEFDLIAVVLASRPPAATDAALGSASARILQLCQEPLSVVDLSARMNLPVGVVRALLGQLAARDLIRRSQPGPAALPSEEIYKAVLHGLRAL